MGSKRRIFSATECLLAVQVYSWSSKLDDFGTNRKRVCDFLLLFVIFVLPPLGEFKINILVINGNFGPILHRFRDTATYWRKIANFSHFFPTRYHSSLPRFPLEFRAEVNHQETRVMGLSYSEDPVIVA